MGQIKWSELLERFRSAQDKARRLSRVGITVDEEREVVGAGWGLGPGPIQTNGARERRSALAPVGGGVGARPASAGDVPSLSTTGGVASERVVNEGVVEEGAGVAAGYYGAKSRFGASQLGRLSGGCKGEGMEKK